MWRQIFDNIDYYFEEDRSEYAEILEPSHEIVDKINYIFSEKKVHFILTYNFFDKLISKDYILVGTREDENIIGVVMGMVFSNKLYVTYFCLEKEYRNKGRGIDMIKKLLYLGRNIDHGYHTVAKSISSSKAYRYFFRPIRPYSCREAGYIFPEYERKVERDIWRTSSNVKFSKVDQDEYPGDIYQKDESNYGFFLSPLCLGEKTIMVAVMMFFKSDIYERENTFMSLVNSVAKTEAVSLHLGETDILDFEFLLSMNCLTAGNKTFYFETFPPDKYDPDEIYPIL